MKRIVTQSELSTWKLCHFKHYLKYVKRLRRTGGSISTLMGHAGHEGQKSFYLSGDITTGENAIKICFDKYREEQVDSGWFLPMREKWEKARETMLNVFGHYVDFYQNDSFEVVLNPIELPLLKPLAKPMAEQEFRIPVVTNCGKASQFFDFAGKIDLLVNYDAGLWIVDHKFKAKGGIDDSLQDALRISLQMRSYVYAFRVYLGIPIKGACLNVILRKAPGKPNINKNGTVSLAQVDTTLDIYETALNKQDAWLQENGKPGLDFEKYEKEKDRIRNIKWFARYFYEYSDEELMEVQREIYTISNEIRQCEKFGPWAYFKNDQACNIYGRCGYAAICHKLSTDERFLYEENLHIELDGGDIHPYKGKGFIIDTKKNMNELMSFEDVLNEVS